MMTRSGNSAEHSKNGRSDTAPRLNITKLGIVSRDYRRKFANGYRDFSQALPYALKLLHNEACDAVLFSLFSIVPRDSYNFIDALNGLKNIKAVFLEEFQDKEPRTAGRFVVYHLTNQGWGEYEVYQKFGTITGMAQGEIDDFVKKEMPRRILGNCCVLLCGETNGVKYSKKDKSVHDNFGVRSAIPQNVNIILNPIHDRMTRFEMKLKRRFLSKNGGWVVSVWNKGKEDKNGKVKDGNGPAWTIFHSGKEIELERIPNKLGVEIEILDIKRA